MKFKHHLMVTSALLAAAIGTAAQAQSNVIEELVVTAEKREQSLQDVPVAVSAFTSERRDLIGITTVQDMTNFTPGLQYSSQLDRASLRGVGRLTNVHAAEGAVAIYSDGIYTSSTVEAGKPPIFSDRVEVLRGPQGTLYGRNAIGGAINIISKRPTEEWYGEVRGRYENYNRTVFEGAVSGPTGIEGVQFRLAASWDKQRDGWIDNIVPGMPDEGNIIDTRILEGQLKFQFTENFEAWMKLASYKWENGGGGPGSRQTWTPFPYPTYQASGGALVLNPGYACRPGTGVTNVVNPSPQGCVNPAVKDARKIASTVPYDVDLDSTVIFASEWIYHFDNFDLKYVAGGTHYHYYLTGPTPADATAPITSFTLPTIFGLPGGLTIQPRYGFDYQEIETWISHELNLASTNDGPFQWLLGAYNYWEEYEQPVYTTMFDQPELSGPLALPTVFCAQTLNSCAPIDQRRIYDNRPELEIKSRAVFGQIDWEFAPTWKTTLGLRYSQDEKSGRESVRVLCFAVPACLAAPELNPVLPGAIGSFVRPVDLTQLPTVVSAPTAAQGLPPGVSSFTTYDRATGFATRSYDAEWSAVTGTAGLQWEPNDDSLIYARYSRGYKAGGFRIGIDTVLGASPITNKELADAFEVGLKQNFLNDQLQVNLAAFRYNYDNAQVPITVVATSGGLAQANSIFYNIPKAISQGIEVETTWQPINNLQFLFNYSYLDAKVKEAIGVVDPADPAALDRDARPVGTTTSADIFTRGLPGGGFQRGQNLAGNRMPNAPKHKVALNGNYTWDMGEGSLTASATYVWRDEQYGSIFTRSYFRSPAYDQVDARVTWKDGKDRFTVILYGRNIFDELGYEGGAGADRREGTVPSINGAVVTQVPIVEGIASTYPLTPPRTFGIELQYKFF
ncbi:TonB-dependent receptor [Phenylobacterium sp.]|uniref:TonB-dependent receptor n=1 Tax=Phenylobacterium sp. TaxID=1871053 RepID=UPI00398309C1